MQTPAPAVPGDGSPMVIRVIADAATRGATLKAQPSVAPKMAARFHRLLNDLFPTEEILARYREALGDEVPV